MAIDIESSFEADRPPSAVARANFAVGLAMRLALVGACLSVIGAVALFAGGIAPHKALALGLCGGCVAFLSLRFLTRWKHAQPMTSTSDHYLSPTFSGLMRQPICFIE